MRVQIANGKPQLEAAAATLVEAMYTSRGLHIQNAPRPAPTLSATTLVACAGDSVFASLTLGIDHGEGLLADARYRTRIDPVRNTGGRACEVTRLATNPAFSSQHLLAMLFNAAYVIAYSIHRATDMFAEVHPRHAGYYRRMLGFTVAGPESICPRVGAPAVLLHLPFSHIDGEIQRIRDDQQSSLRSLYRHFMAVPEHLDYLAELMPHR
jgi:hypothetical protein